MKNVLVLLLVSGALAVLGWLAAFKIKAPAIQADIQQRVQEALAANDFNQLQVVADGRDVTVSGVVRTKQRRQYALETANVYGVRQISNDISVQQVASAQVQGAQAESTVAKPSGTTVAVKPVKVKKRVIPYRIMISHDSAGVYVFDGVVDGPEFKQAVDAHLVALGEDPTKAIWRVEVSSGVPPKNWQESILKSLGVLRLLEEGNLSVKDGKALLTGTAASQDISDQAEAIAQELVEDFDDIDMRFEVSQPKAAVKESASVPMVGSANYAKKFCQTGFDVLLKQEQIRFESGSADLQKGSLQLLEKIAQIATRCPDHQIQVHGYTDSQGAAAVNERLSQARAEAVASHLNKLGINNKRLQAIGHGEVNPIASNKTEQGRAKNRRIELIVKGLKKWAI
ncbi:MAG: hypothetical protein CSB47_10050 [Proteobacteria bacterium]|nr:MAG: hypothetical protein CSB47_10050 [Pseudomonadota bacterium]